MKRGKIARAMDYLDEDMIALAAEEKKGKEGKEKKPFRISFPAVRRWAAVGAAAVFTLVAGVGISHFIGGGEATSVVAFDVNPSIELTVSDKEKVVKVDALNAEGEEIVASLDLEKANLNAAVDDILGAMVEGGYLSEQQNSILLSVNAKGGRANRLKEGVSQEVSAFLQGKDIQASLFTQEFSENGDLSQKAAANRISLAKATLVEKILSAGLTNAQGVAYTYEQLAEMKVNELKLLIEEKGLSPAGVTLSGKASEGSFIGRENALSIALTRAGVTQAQNAEVELEYEKSLGGMCYEVEFVFGGKQYEYEINAATGAIVEEELEVGEDWVAPEGYLARAAALEIVYADAKVAATAVSEVEFELKISGESAVYSIEFKASNKEYEYEINGKTGEIIRRLVEDD